MDYNLLIFSYMDRFIDLIVLYLLWKVQELVYM